MLCPGSDHPSRHMWWIRILRAAWHYGSRVAETVVVLAGLLTVGSPSRVDPAQIGGRAIDPEQRSVVRSRSQPYGWSSAWSRTMGGVDG
jgi:hypothetical protein